jgi:probable HAF family extracellular repeat protein
MNSKIMTRITALALFAALAIPVHLAAEERQKQTASVHHYKVIDLGTFGGPESFFFTAPVVQSVNNGGTVAGGADNSLPDPTSPCFFDCFTMHAFKWQNGVLTDLGTLPGGANSTAYWVNEQGLVMGGSENGVIDPVLGQKQIAVVWKDGQIISLGTLGGGLSFGNAVNNRGEVVGISPNAIPDPFSFLSFLGVGTQTRAFLWRDGVLLDLGTLGGPDGWAVSVNERGQIAGYSYTNSTPNPTTGIPTVDPFLWQNGAMTDLGTLGGTFAVVGSLNNGGSGAGLNNRGQVIGTSNLAGDLIHHPFLWDAGVLTDLGTLGGDNGEAFWINEGGEIVGRADFSPSSSDHHGFLWKDGKMIDLGVPDGQTCSTAIDINSRGQIIIDTAICGVSDGPGAIWENGKLYDLNSLISPNSGVSVAFVSFINDRGEITAEGDLPSGGGHAILLVPCDENHPGMEGCDYSLVDASTAAVASAPRIAPSGTQRSPQSRWTNRYRIPGRGTGPTN